MNSTRGEEIVFRVRESLDVTLMVTQLMRHPILADAAETDRNTLVTVASELGTNIVKYAKFGTVSVRRRSERDGLVIDVMADDSGPGIPDLALALQDHYSTGNSLGLGLPAVRRMMDSLQIDSAPAAGVRVFASKRITGGGTVKKSTTVPVAPSEFEFAIPFEVGVALRPLHGRQACGDATYCRRDSRGVLVGIFDGLGHGSSAAQAAQTACGALDAAPCIADLKHCFDALNDALRATVGAVGVLCHIDYQTNVARLAGVGNVSCMRVTPERWTLISRDGVLGQRLPSVLIQTLLLRPGDLLAFWTDGLGGKGLPQHLAFNSEMDLPELARIVVQEFGRPYDDAGVLLLRWRGA